MDLLRERDRALKRAQQYAGGGNVQWAQLWLNRASQFWPVTTRQLANVQWLLGRAQLKGA